MATATQVQPTEAPSAATDAGMPTLNPANSPYAPLDLPTVEPTVVKPEAEERPPADLGAVSHAGAAAYMIDSILKGASHGYAVGQQYAAEQYNKKLGALQSLYNEKAKQYYEIAKSGRAGTYTGPPGKDGKPTFVPSPEFEKARKQTLALWQSMMTVMGERIPKLKGSKGKKESADANDPNALIKQVLNHNQNPDDALAATYLLAQKMGPPVNHQVAGFLSPQYIARQNALSHGVDTEIAAHTATAQAVGSKAQLQQDLYDSSMKLANAATPEQKAALQKSVDADISALYPQLAAEGSWTTKLGTIHGKPATILVNSKRPGEVLSLNGQPMSPEDVANFVPGTASQISAAPKLIPNTGLVEWHGHVYGPNDPDAPPEVAKLVNGAASFAAKKQQNALALAAIRGAAFEGQRPVATVNPDNPAQVIYTTAQYAENHHLATPQSVGYRLSIPTSSMRQRAGFAVSALNYIDTMERIIESHPEIFGPAAGRATRVSVWLGSQSPDAQAWRAARTGVGEHLEAVFGARSAAAADAIEKAAGELQTNPQAALAGLNQLAEGARIIRDEGTGVLPPEDWGDRPGTQFVAPAASGGTQAHPEPHAASPTTTHDFSLSAWMKANPGVKGAQLREVVKQARAEGYTVIR